MKIRYIAICLLIPSLLVMMCSTHRMTRESGLESVPLLRSVHLMTTVGTSKIVGQAMDRETHEPIIGINIHLTGTNFSALSDNLGNYGIDNVPAGTYTIRAFWPAYHLLVLDSLRITENELVILDLLMAQAAIKFDE